MELHGRLEGNEEEQLVVSTALNPILRGTLAIAKRARLRGLEQNLDGASLVISVQKFAASNLNLIGNVAVSSWDLGTFPGFTTVTTVTTARTRGLTQSANFSCQLLNHGLKFARVGPLYLLDDLSVPEEQKSGQRCDAVLLGNVFLRFGIDLHERDRIWL